METSLFKIATSSYHMAHPLSDDANRYQKWDAKGILAFTLLTIFTLGVGGAVVLGTAYAKLKRLKKLKAEDTSASKKVDVSAQKAGIKTSSAQVQVEKKTVEPKIPATTEEVPKVTTTANLFDVEENNARIALIDKFENSAPEIFPGYKKPNEIQDLYHAEIQKFETFLEEEMKETSNDDLVYFCAGHGSVHEQVWPGFVFEALQKDQKVKTILVEQGFKYPEFRQGYAAMITHYEGNYLDQEPDIIKKFQNFSVNQFLCGLVSSNDRFESDKKVNPDISKPVWRSKEQVNHVVELIPQYLEKLLSEGKQVVIGDHQQYITENDFLVKVYNGLIEKYPDQLHFLWGWQRTNALTDKIITKSTIDEGSYPEAPESPKENWKKYDNLAYIQFSDLISDNLLEPIVEFFGSEEALDAIKKNKDLNDDEKADDLDKLANEFEKNKKWGEAERSLLYAKELDQDNNKYFNKRIAEFYLNLAEEKVPLARFRAIEWCKKMFKDGDTLGAVELGHHFEKEKNYKLAHYWYKSASEHDNKHQRGKNELEAFNSRLGRENILLD